MRTFTVACLAMGLFLQVGCASISKMTAHRKQKANEKTSAEYLAVKELEIQGKQEKARERYEALLAKDPENPEYMHRLAVVCTRLQRYAEADDYYERAHRRAPKDASLLVDMGFSLYLRGDRVEAERLLREAVHLKPSDKRALNNLALVVGVQGKIEESLSLLQQTGDESTALSSLAYIHSQRGEMDLSEQRYRDALEKNPNNKDAIKALAELEKRRSQDAIVAESTPTRTETFRLTELPSTEFDSPAIQQAAAVVEKGSSVTTANFVEESSEPSKPALLDETPEPPKRPVANKKTTFKFDDEEQMGDEIPSTTPATTKGVVKPQNDDWASDDRPAMTPAKRTSAKLPSEFDADLDDEFATQAQSVPIQTSPGAKRLTFVPSKSRMAQPNSLPMKSAGKQSATTTDTSDQIE